MKRNEVLRYPLADIGPESPVMTVRLHRTPSGYWRFDVRYNHQIVEVRTLRCSENMGCFACKTVTKKRSIAPRRNCSKAPDPHDRQAAGILCQMQEMVANEMASQK